ncbi:MAG TPA: decaprenylphospho-beta-D-erythro-pentofuranosid-2-ulose 2-reductase [Micromonosporaceae bacterium]|nr:decaprenylphospho-beta-D-erythro-pentofuranosid-2-ulose 2-reductase [Micromonosporaceae bacterium]
MIDALGTPQSLLLLGGTSDIGLAIAYRYLSLRRIRIVLAGRASDRLDAASARLIAAGASVETVEFDAANTDPHESLIEGIFAMGDIDVAVVAFGLLDQQCIGDLRPSRAVEIARVNYLGAVSVGVTLARAMCRQGHGAIVALSSVAGERVRGSNFLYGSTKAGMDAFYTGLGDCLAGSGVRVVVVRPGHVRTKMTAHLPDAPLATTPDAVAAAVTNAVWSGRQQVWVPRLMRPVMSVLRHLPRSVFRRLPL